MAYSIPMYESEAGWGSKIDGYAGPFETKELAETFRNEYNLKYINEDITPDYYIVALEPVPSQATFDHNYRSTVSF